MYKAFILIMLVPLFSLSAFANDAVVARVNNAVITVKDLEEAVNRLIPRATYHGGVSEEKRDELRQKALEDLIDRELLYQDAAAKGLKPEKKLVEERMEVIRERFASKKDYKKALKEAGITEDQLRERAGKTVLIEANLRKHVTEPALMTDEALQEYYTRNITKFKQPESARIRIITAQDEKKGKEALARIKAGEDFGDVAARMSEDSYRIKGGDLGYVHKGRILPELEDAAFKMKAGETSDLIKAEGTWFIVKLEDFRPAHQMTFEESKNRLKQDLEAKRSAELKEKLLAELHAKAVIEVLLKPAGEEQDTDSHAATELKK